ncbi:MAG: hypothetical protein IKI64_04475 [Clostridia bacterium]|nr:hypothetical protein [Clostridia bacterium]
MDKLKLRNSELEAINQKLLNPNINDLTKALLGVVRDRQEGTIFFDYEQRETIGMYIYAELLDKYDENIGFFLSDDLHESGLLTQAQGACSLDVLIGDYRVFSILDDADAAKLKEIYERTIDSIIKRVSGKDGTFIFDASPYNVEAFNAEYAYIDSMTWVVSALLGALNFCELRAGDNPAASSNAEVSFSYGVQQKMLDIVSYCIKYLTKSFIDITDKNEKKLSQGWNFTKGCSEPSLYFTYAVSECYLDIFDAFKKVIDKHNIEEKIAQIKSEHVDSSDNSFDYNMYLSNDDRVAYESINADSDEYRMKKRLFEHINGDDDIFYQLEKQVKLAARNSWALVKDGIDTKFYNSNLSAVVEQSIIENSSSSDALFNNLFVINNVITGGLDEELNDRIARAVDDDEMSRIQSEYDNLLETLQAALQRTIRYSKMLQAKQKDYVINDFVISCNETFEGEFSKKSQELRKKRIKTFTISPLLVKTNNLISEFLAKYPQYDMIKYLDDLIMKKRSMDDDSNYIWVWECGEYQVTSNYYYLISLSSFYKYIDEYETRFTAIDHDNEEYKASLRTSYLHELRRTGEIFKLTEQNNKLESENVRLQEQILSLQSQESELEKVVKNLIHEEIKANLLSWVVDGVDRLDADVFQQIIGGDLVEEDFPAESAFFDAIKKMLIIAFASIVKDKLNYTFVDDPRVKGISQRFVKVLDKKAASFISDAIGDKDFN